MEKDIRAHVLRVALEELNQCGPAFHMDDLARRLHISKRTLYENFSSKQEIVKNAILSVMDDLYTHHVKLIEDESKTVEEKLLTYFDARSEMVEIISLRQYEAILRKMPEIAPRIGRGKQKRLEFIIKLFARRSTVG